MLVKNEIRLLIPRDIKMSTGSITSEIELWLELEYIQARVTREYVKSTDKMRSHRIEFDNPKHETMFRLKYSQYIDD